ncbi:MAG: 2-oxo acid dehydrogenase subunit E2, partial [Candidatus Latescibacteria bacterium]|nr:2-oxo acid dehydrogenase subunit E2 [Candidatus Latescibacterota bacterium]
AFDPLLDPPQVGILGVGRVVQKPAVFEGDVVVRSMCFLSLTFDHRAVDGAYAAAFLAQLKQMLESPRDCLDLSSTGESGGESAVNDGCTGND